MFKSKTNNNAVIKIAIVTSLLLSWMQGPHTAQAHTTVATPLAASTNKAADHGLAYGNYAKRTAKNLAAPLASPPPGQTLPIEVLIGDDPANIILFPNGFTKEVTVTVANAANAKKFWMQANSLSYQDKASVQINNSAWVTLNNTTTAVLQPAKRYGGIGGAFRTLKLTFDVPPGVVVNGDNVIRFRFNRTDGESMGFRVINFNFWNAGNAPMLPNPPIPFEDPNTWVAPLNTPGDIAEGETLWRSRNIMTNNPLDPSTFKASCADCHSQSGYDLKFFNFSNTSVIERARFHGLTTVQGQKIASFIRSLGFENPGRPWNPPYQPGPGLEAKPVDEWAAGAGVDAVLEKDEDIQAFLPNNAGNAADLISGARVKKFNVRDVPVAFEMPDWNQWLPKVHPIDSMGVLTFENSANFTFYDTIRKGLLGTLPGFTRDEYVYKQLRSDLDNWAYAYAPDSKSPELAALGPSGNNPFTKKQVTEQYAAAIWSASKLFEIMHEFELEELGRTLYGAQGESRQWLSNRHIFNFSPHLLGMSHAFPVTGDGKAELINLAIANSWYWMQIILNPGARNSITGGWNTNDWDYTSSIMNGLYFESDGAEPLRSLLLTYKGMDNGDDGYGPEGRNLGGLNGAWWGWDMRDNATKLVGAWQQNWWTNVPEAKRRPALTALYSAWLQKSGSFSVERWRKMAATKEAPDFAFNISSPDYPFVIPNFGATSDLENVATMLAFQTRRLRDDHWMDDAIHNGMADLGSLLWPNNPWNTLITRSGAAPSGLQATPGIEQVTLTWGALGGANSYNIKRSDFLTGTFVPVGLFVNGTSFVDRDLQAGRTFYYEVSANIGSGETNNSAAVSGKPAFGLVGYWPLDGGTTVTDLSVTQNPALAIGTISMTAGHKGNAIALGAQSFVATERNLRWLAGDFTFSAWVSTTATGDNNLMLAPALAGSAGEAEDNPLELYETPTHRRYDRVGNRFAVVGGLDASGRIGASFGNDPSVVVKSTQAINNGAWRHVVVSRDSTSGLVKVFVDGALSASGTMTTGYLYQRSFGLGRAENPLLNNFFKGSLDEVKIFDRPLNNVEVALLYNDLTPAAAAITNGNLPAATYGTPYTFTFTSTGTPTPTLTLSGTLPAGLSFSPNANGTAFLSGTPTAAGSALITVTATNGIESPAQSEYTVVVNKAPLTMTADNKIRVYGIANPALTVTYGGLVNSDTPSVLSGTPALVATPTTTTPAGVYAVSISVGSLAAANYTFNTFINGTLTITGAPPEITSGTPPAGTYASAYAFTLSASGDPTPTLSVAGLPAGLSLTNNVITGTPTSAGSYPIRVTANNGVATPDVNTYTLVINKVPLTVTAANKIRVFGVANPTLTATYSGFVHGDTPSVLSGAPSLVTTPTATTLAGVYAIATSIGSLSAANYTFSTFINGTLTITGAQPTITSGAPPAGIYASAYAFTLSASGDPAPTLSVAGLPAGLSLSNNVITGTPTAAGSYPITITANNGVGAADQDHYTLVIGKVVLTATADNKARPYGVANPTFTASYTGFVHGDTQSVVLGSPVLTTTANAASLPGTYPINISNGTLGASNYLFALVSGSLTVTSTPVNIVSHAPTTATYGLAYSFTVTATGSPTPTVSVMGLPAGLSFNDGKITGTPMLAGSSQITVTADNGTYTDEQVYTLVVSRVTLTVTADDKARPYGEANPVFTSVITGFVNGDDVSVVAGSPTLTTTADEASLPGLYPILSSLGTLSATNYAFAFVDGTLMVTSTTVIILSGPPATGRYGSAYIANVTATGAPTPTVTIFGLPAGLSFAAGKITGTPLAAGSSLITVTADNNYTRDTRVYTLTINTATLTVTADNLSRVVSTPNPTLSVSYAGFVNGDDAGDLSNTPDLATTATLASPPGIYAIVVNQGNLDSVNYDFVFVDGRLVIVSQAPVLTTTNPPTGTYGTPYSYTFEAGGNPTATVTISGALPPGLIFISNTLIGTPTQPGTFVITVTASNDGGEFSPNIPGVSVQQVYTITIRKAVLTVQANSLTRPEGEANPALTVSYTGFVRGDTAENTLTGAPALTTTATVSSVPNAYPVQVGVGSLASAYYDFVFANGTLTVTARRMKPRVFLPFVVNAAAQK